MAIYTLPERVFMTESLEDEATDRALILVAGSSSEKIYHPLGSGVFVQRHLILTAKHVVQEAYIALGGNHTRTFDSVPPFEIRAYNWPGVSKEQAAWAVKGIWETPYSDLALLSVIPNNDVAQKSLPRIAAMSVIPPPLGEYVMAIGYPKTKTEVDPSETPDSFMLKIQPSSSVGRVTQVFEERRERGMLAFPCFEVGAHVFGGMSGGPIYNIEGELCGIVCSSMEGHPTFYGVTLWPLLGMYLTHDPHNRPLVPPVLFGQIGSSEHFKGLKIAERVYVAQDADTGEKYLRLKPA